MENADNSHNSKSQMTPHDLQSIRRRVMKRKRILIFVDNLLTKRLDTGVKRKPLPKHTQKFIADIVYLILYDGLDKSKVTTRRIVQKYNLLSSMGEFGIDKQ
jgi:hypothetical protein